MDNNIIFKTHQHIITLFFKVGRSFIVLGIIFGIIVFLGTQSLLYTILVLIIILVLIYFYHYFFYSKSYFYITSDKLSINVRNGVFSQYNMSIYFDQIKDMAYSKNNFLHYFFDYGVLFVRSSAGSEGNFTVSDIPHIEEVYKKVNFMYCLSNDDRKKVKSLSNLKEPLQKTSKEDVIKSVKTQLLSIKGIKELVLLTNEDKKFIFETEEDRNHGVYECIKRQITFVVSHDSSFRDADHTIVLKLGNKVIFPPVSFHEIKEKNTISSSPGLEVHNYLIKKLKNIGENDATLLIGFDY